MDKMYIVKNESGVKVRVLAPNPQVAKKIAKIGLYSHGVGKLQVIKPQNRKR